MRIKPKHAVFLLALTSAVLWLLPLPAFATFSIVACDKAGNCGVAVATDNLAVGASVPYAQAHVGALTSQFETNPSYGPKGMALLSAGVTPEAAIRRLLEGDGNFDGTSTAERQVGLVDAQGHAANYTGAVALTATWAGALKGDGYSVQGNGLAGAVVLSAMEQTFLSAKGALAERLMASLEAGQAAGGQSIGKMSAALLVRTTDGGWQDIDLRVDGAAEPIEDLRRLLDQHDAWQLIIRAEHEAHDGNNDAARASMAEALRLSHRWDRVWRRAARLAISMGDKQLALDDLGVFVSINPTWARSELKDDIYRPLHDSVQFQAWLH
jgi:uncharacterized Ntn-hydrolase superfamily protein